jgi:CMP-2-keto-3-deoxyoctulosonic acid synthetase
MRCVVAVLARLESSWLPGKVMADIGAKPMLRRVLEAGIGVATFPVEGESLSVDTQEQLEQAPAIAAGKTHYNRSTLA